MIHVSRGQRTTFWGRGGVGCPKDQAEVTVAWWQAHLPIEPSGQPRGGFHWRVSFFTWEYAGVVIGSSCLG